MFHVKHTIKIFTKTILSTLYNQFIHKKSDKNSSLNHFYHSKDVPWGNRTLNRDLGGPRYIHLTNETHVKTDI